MCMHSFEIFFGCVCVLCLSIYTVCVLVDGFVPACVRLSAVCTFFFPDLIFSFRPAKETNNQVCFLTGAWAVLMKNINGSCSRFTLTFCNTFVIMLSLIVKVAYCTCSIY